MAAKNIVFDGYDLQSADVIVSKIEHDNIPAKELRRYRLVRADGEIITDSRFGGKRILVIGRLKATSSAFLEYALDDFRAAMAGYGKENKQLLVEYTGGGTNRVYNKATCVSISVDRRQGTTNFAEFQLEFISTLPYGESESPAVIENNYPVATSPLTIPVNFGGNARQKPVMELTVTSFTGASINTISLKNDTTGVGISISRAFVAGDVIEIDVPNMIVKVNGNEVDYGGAFPDFESNTSTDLIVSDDFTARSMSLDINCTLRYL